MEIHENRNLEDLDGELWKEIEEYNRDYFVSNFGRIKSFKRYRGNNENILKQNKNKDDGYFYVCLCKNRKKKTKRIHTLMYENHIGKIPKGCEIHHKDFAKNNFLDNFEVMTKEKHTSKHNKNKIVSEKTRNKQSETRKEKFKNDELNLKGEYNPNVILQEQNIIEIRIDLKEGLLTQTEIGEKFGVSRHTISRIKTGKLWKHIK